MRALVFTLVLGCACSGVAQVCRAAPAPSEGQINMLLGTYDLVGQDPQTQKPFLGRLNITYQNKKLVLTRTVGGQTLTGKGTFVLCWADHIPAFEAVYSLKGGDFGMICTLGWDDQNAARATCKSSLNVPNRKYGLEAWFQR